MVKMVNEMLRVFYRNQIPSPAASMFGFVWPGAAETYGHWWLVRADGGDVRAVQVPTRPGPRRCVGGGRTEKEGGRPQRTSPLEQILLLLLIFLPLFCRLLWFSCWRRAQEEGYSGSVQLGNTAIKMTADNAGGHGKRSVRACVHGWFGLMCGLASGSVCPEAGSSRCPHGLGTRASLRAVS